MMQGTLSAEFSKDGKSVLRRLNPDREYQTVDGASLTVPGRSLVLIRNVGLHLYSDSVRDRDSRAIPEGVADALRRMAAVVDCQFGSPMSELAFGAARDLIFLGQSQPNGYTETILNVYRRRAKGLQQTRAPSASGNRDGDTRVGFK
jgi:malate synthase